ncbi:PH domain-containing protein [Arenimonas donghaensis]|nr:PH domain-containing protein [Arenimonas donghaensis]
MTDMFRNFALPPIGKSAIWFAVVLGTLVPATTALVVIGMADALGDKAMVVVALQAVVALLVLAILLPMWRRQVAFDGKQLRVKATYYSRQSPLSDFRLDEARVVDTRERTEFKPLVKTNGFGLPGFWAGHFLLRDKRKAFCLVTDVGKVLALPHADGRVWLLSFEHPQAVLDILRRAAA